jgi:CxxC motif-containing protein (DUF1111 family)
MHARHVALIALVAAFTAASLGAIAQRSTEPTGHRHKLRHLPPLPRPPADGNATLFGAPLVGLSAAELAAFAEGREEFESIETADGGLGPIFNNNSCAACHTAPVSGGASMVTVTRFGKSVAGHFDPLAEKGGSLLQQFATEPEAQERVPAEANVVAKRVTTPLFGAGLLEAIPDAEIRLNEARNQPDGVSGRAAVITDVVTGKPRIGRFGWKAQHASLLGFAADAYFNEMGVTSRFFPSENAPNGDQDRLAKYLTTTGINDPANADGRSDIDASADFMRLLAPPPPLRPSASALAGARLFGEINCDACHRPVMFTGASPIAAIAHKAVPLFSDLLLHDMGTLGDGIAQGAAGTREIKTAPLWGLRARPVFLHDGRAATVRDAILGHAGEATAARNRFDRLDRAAQQQLIDFLNTI